ncbi:MAG: HAD-IC family P-type ATPase [Candidatus Dependentiae bacterium]|nr:HAD-IC family P-type ATPase [Candidatus Dependentiae bacterium]
MEPHQLTVAQLIRKLNTDAHNGLSYQEFYKRLAQYGPNKLLETPVKSWPAVFLSQFYNPLIYILLAAATIIFFAGPDKLDAFIISGVLLFNAIIGTIQEGRTRSILESLKQFIVSQCVVIRDGQKMLVNDEDLVVGDLILLQEGNRVPADARIIESNNLNIDEAILTGESMPVRKNIDIVEDEAILAERTNIAYKGTYILAGSGRAIVIATGAQTAIGKIHASTEEIQTDMPLKQELDRVSYVILIGIFLLCIGLFAIGFATGKPLKELLVMVTALFICVVPEGLPVVFTLVLVGGVYRMAKQNVLVKNMQAVEALGRADVIITDKTGTLTRNEMVVTDVFADQTSWKISGSGYHTQGSVMQGSKKMLLEEQSELTKLAIAASLLNSAEINYDAARDLFTIKGDPTEAALYVFSQKIGLVRDDLETSYKKIYEIPFDPLTPYHVGFYQKDSEGVAFIIGSPELVMQRSTIITPIMQKNLAEFLDSGLRVVAVAIKSFSIDNMPDQADKQLIFFKDQVKTDLTILGVVGIQDAIRPEVAGVITQARMAGLRIIMATGDHQKTALRVAKEVGIFTEGDRAIDGSEFNCLSDEELVRALDHTTVYSRVSPENKLRIITMFHRLGKIVAMTGDGINDVPSLIAADLGIAMGQIGTEVAKQSSDIVLLDDSFVNIVKAIEQGRHIFGALRRVILYFFTTNLGEVLIVLFALSLGLPLPITAAQILWLNLVTDGFLNIALSVEPEEPGLLHKSWLTRKLRLVDRNMILKSLFMALPMGIGSLLVFYANYKVDLAYARTMTLLTMAMFQWFNVWNCRSEKLSIVQSGLFSNRWLLLSTSFVLCLQFLLIYAPFMHAIFKTVPLSLDDWRIVIMVSSSIVVLEEVRKFVARFFARA